MQPEKNWEDFHRQGSKGLDTREEIGWSVYKKWKRTQLLEFMGWGKQTQKQRPRGERRVVLCATVNIPH